MLLPGEWGEAEEIDLTLWERTEDDGPPNLSDEELEKIDAEAETKEVTRLLQMRVLIPEDENNKIDESYRKLTTKHIKDWCFRENHWQRRSRLVARDYKFLAPELEGLFSPASNSLSTKLWAAVVQSANGELELCSADVKDAYLMVEPDEKVFVTTSDGTNYSMPTKSQSWKQKLVRPVGTGVKTEGPRSLQGKPAALLQAKINENFFFRPTPDRLSSRKENCILQIHRINAVATSVITTMCIQKMIS